MQRESLRNGRGSIATFNTRYNYVQIQITLLKSKIQILSNDFELKSIRYLSKQWAQLVQLYREKKTQNKSWLKISIMHIMFYQILTTKQQIKTIKKFSVYLITFTVPYSVIAISMI